MRVTEGDNVSITVINSNESKHPHSLHLHSIHAGAVDGTNMNGPSGNIAPGHNFTYNFIAGPTGVFPYHCHMPPVADHINHGLYGTFIIDPKNPRPLMNEMVMVLNGYSLNPGPYPAPITPIQAAEVAKGEDGNKTIIDTIPEEHDNAIYSVNGQADYYMNNPIHLKLHENNRIYLVNMLDFEENSFHLHGQMFEYYPAGTSTHASFKTDVISLSQGDRGILEFKFDLPGCFMFHAHPEQIAIRGWQGVFSVADEHGKGGCDITHMPSSTTHLVTDDE